MLVKDIPQFGIYNNHEYLLATVLSLDDGHVQYRLPPSEDGVYNIVLHGLLRMQLEERRTVLVEVASDFDLECQGIHLVNTSMLLEQHLHLSPEGNLCLSPNVGQFRLTNPRVTFQLKLTCELRVWNFDVTLHSTVQQESLPIERYAWIRLGKPQIDEIGQTFVNEIGRDIVYERMQTFLLARQGLLDYLPPLEFGLREHLDRVLNSNDQSLNMVPECIQQVLFYRSFELLKDLASDDLEFGKHSYLQQNAERLWLPRDDKVLLLTELIESLDQL